MIIVVGCDNTGKTTLVNHLSTRLHIPVAPRFHSLPPKGKEWLEWYEFIKTNLIANTNVIYDRFFIDEYVYGPLKRGGYIIGIEKMAELTNLMLMAQPLVIYTYLPKDRIIDSFKKREQYIKEEDVQKVLSGYSRALKHWPLNQLTNVARFNYLSDLNYHRITCVVNNYLREGHI